MNEEHVNHPSHYNVGKYEVIDVIYGWGLDFDLGNALKYIARAGHKASGSLDLAAKTKEDLNKAIWYLQHERKMITEHGLSFSISDNTGMFFAPGNVTRDWQLDRHLAQAVEHIYWSALGDNADMREGHIMAAITQIREYLLEK